MKVKKFKVDTLKRKLIGNLMKVPRDSIDILSEHYDLHKHTSSGATSPLALQNENTLNIFECRLDTMLVHVPVTSCPCS